MEKFIDFVIQQWLLFAIAILLLVMLVRNLFAAKLSGVNNVNANEAVRLMNDDALVLDVRLEKEFKTGHIENAVNIPVGALEARIKELDKYKGKAILVQCQTGNRSLRGAQILKKHGFDDVHNLSGGIMAWINANMPVTKGGKKKKK